MARNYFHPKIARFGIIFVCFNFVKKYRDGDGVEGTAGSVEFGVDQVRQDGDVLGGADGLSKLSQLHESLDLLLAAKNQKQENINENFEKPFKRIAKSMNNL